MNRSRFSGILLILAISSPECDSFGLVSSPRSTILSIRSKRKSKRRTRLASSEEWTVGDVYRDFDRLEQAINFANAEENLKQAERIEMLEYCARQRRPINVDAKKFIVTPLVLAFIFRIFHEIPRIKVSLKILTACMDIHFWSIVIGSPILLLVAKLISMPPPDPLPEELKGLDPEYLPFITTDWENPETSSKDHVLFILEYWVSAVLGMAVIGLAQLLKKINNHNTSVKVWLSIAQLLTRVGALASIHQYQRQIFQLLRSRQPRPLGFFSSTLRFLIRCMVVCAPLGLASDLFKSLLYVQRDFLVAFFTSVSTLLFGTWVRMQDIEPGVFKMLEKKSFGGKLIQTVAMLAFWKKPILNIQRRFHNFPFQSYISSASKFALTYGSIAFIGLLPILSPIIHMMAVRKLFRVVYTHDLSLSMEADAFKSALENQSEMQEKMKWRYRLEWRDEKRLIPLLKEWNSGWGYWLFIQGTVNEKLALELREQQKRADMVGLNIFDRLKDDSMPRSNRDEWKKAAMERLAQKHQSDYEKNDFADPLGVAVHQRLGIGLGFNFDHMRNLEKDEKPSIRRLQARAAKSAVQRVNELYDPKRAKEALKDISEPAERKKKAAEIRKQTDDEIKYLAKRLTELVPAGASEEFERKSYIQQFRQTNFKRTSPHEYNMDDPFGTESATEILFNRNLDTTKGNENATSSNNSDDFLEAYIQDLENDKDDSDDSPIILV